MFFSPLHHHHHHHTVCRVLGLVTSSGSISGLEVFRGVFLGFERLVIPHGEIMNALKSQFQQPGRFFALLISSIQSFDS